jgi:hypothetical protein
MLNSPRINRIEKNYLINGGMDLFQRGANSSINLGTSYAYQTADRWALKYAGTFSGTPVSLKSNTVPNALTRFALQFSGNATDGTAECDAQQRVESFESVNLVGLPVSFSALVYSTSAIQVIIELSTPNSADNFGGGQTIFATQTTTIPLGVWTLVKFENVTVPLLGANGLGINVRFVNWSVTGSTQTASMNQAMLNVGDEISGFVRHGLTFPREIQAAQRFYEKSYDIDTDPATVTASSSWHFFAHTNSSNWEEPLMAAILKRVNPSTFVVYSPGTGATSKVYSPVQGDLNASIDFETKNGSVSISGITTNVTRELLFHYTLDSEIL